MVLAIMRHGRRMAADDSPLLGYHPTHPDSSCPEVWESIYQLVPTARQRCVTAIVTSPYLRTRQTAALVQYGLWKYTGHLLPIHVDTRIGEYIPRRHLSPVTSTTRNMQQRAEYLATFDAVTLQHYDGRVPLHHESFELFLRRVREFYWEKGSACIVVTHAGVAEILGALGERDVSLGVGQLALIPDARAARVVQPRAAPALALPLPSTVTALSVISSPLPAGTRLPRPTPLLSP